MKNTNSLISSEAFLASIENSENILTIEHLILFLIDDPIIQEIFDKNNLKISDFKCKIYEYLKTLDKNNLYSNRDELKEILDRILIYVNFNLLPYKILKAFMLAECFNINNAFSVRYLTKHNLTQIYILSYIRCFFDKNNIFFLNNIIRCHNNRAYKKLYTQKPLTSIIQSEELFFPRNIVLPTHQENKKKPHIEIEHVIDTQKIPFCYNLNEEAKKNNIDSVVGREKEIKRIIEILNKRKKNNLILVGDPGVGKTAIVEGLAKKIINKSKNSNLYNTTIYSLDLASLVAGTKYRGDLEKRIKDTIEHLKKKENVILFIDEIHSIIGNPNSDNLLNITNILKPILIREKIKFIGATTFLEYKNFFEKDKALSRRFQKIIISEPTTEETTIILQNIKSNYENFHNIKYSDEALKSAVELSSKYIKDKYLPDKAIDLIDEAGAQIKLTSPLKTKITQKHIKEVLFSNLNLPQQNKTYNLDYFQELEKSLKNKILGQDKAINSLCNALKIIKANLNFEKQSLQGALLFKGAKNTGKSKLTRELAKELNIEYVHFNMEEYSLASSISRFLGSDLGYFQYTHEKNLVHFAQKYPQSLYFFENINLANKGIINIILEILNKGYITDHTNKKISFLYDMFIFSTNIETKKNCLGFNRSHESTEELDSENTSKIEKDLLTKLNKIIIFEPLSSSTLKKIFIKKINSLSQSLLYKKIHFSISNAVINFLFKKLEKKIFKSMNEVIDLEIKKPISNEILSGTLDRGGSINFYLKKTKLSYALKPFL